MFARLSVFYDGILLAELQVKPTWNDQIKDKQIGDKSPELRFRPIAYQLELPPELDRIHDVFHVSLLRRYRSDPKHIVPVKEIEVRPNLTFEEELVQIPDHDVKVLRRKSIPLVKVLWKDHNTEGATWEPEDTMRQQYPYLF
ncbi:uncharacterized protein LOC128292668 [Gossypium arboreum]|uniref:uncharacterized protein LOC128292668 n=1 Tax=Gossypium arboreum TaxID=29729 RepID=UPI0022F19EA2|nr:uncharacterized protein LOC128292668 [Gossypium arboreum]